MDYVLDTLLQSLREIVPYDHAHILLREADSRMFMAREAPQNAKTRPISKYPMTLDADEYPILRKVLASETPVLGGWPTFPRKRFFMSHNDLRVAHACVFARVGLPQLSAWSH